LQVKRAETAKKTAKVSMPAMSKTKAKAAGPGRSAAKMGGKTTRKMAGKSMAGNKAMDMKVCEKPHDMEHYRLSDEDDACFDSTR
jgi:hypothetical protein